MGRILVLILIFFSVASGQNTKNTILIDETGRSILRIFTACEYKIVLKNPANKEVKVSLNMIGNGYFVDKHHYDSNDFVISAGHIFWCNSSIGDLASKGILEKFDQTHEEDLSMENIVALKDGKIENVFGYTYEGMRVLNIKILFSTPFPKNFSDPDRALLLVTIPEGISHSHILLMEDKQFDKIFYQENVIGKEVVVRGFLLYNDGWFLRYRNALIEWMKPEIFQINELLSQGLSGGPVVYRDNGKEYAMGVVSRGPIQQDFRNFDMTWITTIKKSFLEQRNKK